MLDLLSSIFVQEFLEKYLTVFVGDRFEILVTSDFYTCVWHQHPEKFTFIVIMAFTSQNYRHHEVTNITWSSTEASPKLLGRNFSIFAKFVFGGNFYLRSIIMVMSRLKIPEMVLSQFTITQMNPIGVIFRLNIVKYRKPMKS